MEQFFYAPDSYPLDDFLYGVAAGPADARRAVLVVSPLGNEAVKARRVLWRCVRALGDDGFGALLLDPRGSGESADEFEETTLDGLVADVEAGLAELRRRFPSAEPLIVTFRYTAVAALMADVAGHAARLLLIDACLDPATSIRTDLRLEIVRQARRHGQALEDRNAMLARLDAGEPIVVDGQLLSPDLYHGLVAARPRDSLADWGARATLVASGPSTFPAFYGHVHGVLADQNPAFVAAVLDWAAA